MKLSRKTALPILVLLGGAGITFGMVSARQTVATRAAIRPIPLVHAITVAKSDVSIHIAAQGSVAPRTESDLVSEVSGRVMSVSPSLASGGFFEQDAILARVDPGDYEVATDRAEAQLARAESEFRVASTRLERVSVLSSKGVSSDSDLDDARNGASVADATRRDARAALRQARRDLERTWIRAPFAGRVREKAVDVGQFVSRGSLVARVYAVDYAEVRLPLSDDDAAFIELPIDYRGDENDVEGPTVLLRSRFAGRDYTWEGQLVRTEGELDPRTRMIHAVARIDDPYGRGADPTRPPLAVGLYVEAEIAGRVVENAIVLPRNALRGHDEVAVVGPDDRLTLRKVEILRREHDRVVIIGGLEAGERVCTSPLSFSATGTLVRVAPQKLGADATELAGNRSGS